MKNSYYPSFDLCVELKKAWYPQQWLYWYCDGIMYDDDDRIDLDRAVEWLEWVYTPDLMEILDRIPKKHIILDYTEDGEARITYQTDLTDTNEKSIVADTLPNALAEMTIWLYENNFISFPKN